MARPTKEARLSAVHEEALRAFNAIQSAMLDERRKCLEDRRFSVIRGAQWEGLERQFENKPRFEINKTRRSVDRIIDEYRNNRIGVSFESKDGTPDDKLADACASVHRSDERDSTAEEAYDNAFDEAVSGGIGGWRLRARYADEDDEGGEDDADEARPQRICFEIIPDADSCLFWDLNSRRQDKSDARFCFVLVPMTRDEYKRRYNDDPATWPKGVSRSEFDWAPADQVIVAEYYLVEDSGETIRMFRGLDGETVEHAAAEFEADEELERTLLATGFEEIEPRKPKRRRVHKYLLNGQRVIEDCGLIAGRQIPVVVTYGHRAFVDGRERCWGHIRFAKDAQRILNMVLSKLGELCAMSSIEKPILTPEQIAGHQNMWATDNIQNWAYLLINPTTDAAGNTVNSGPLAYTKSPAVPQALSSLALLAQDALKDILGNPQEAEKMISHVAGKTAEILQTVLDKQAYIYIENMAKAIRRSGQIWLSMAREIYSQPGRKLKGITRLNTLTQVELLKPVLGADGRPTAENDLTRAALDVSVDVGPSSATRRQAAVQASTAMLPVVEDPETKVVLSSVALANMDGEGLEGPRKWARLKLVRMGAEKPTPEEAQQLKAEAQGQQPSAADQYALAAARESEAKAVQAAAQTEKIRADVDKVKADTIATLADVDLSRRQAAIDAVESLHGMIPAPTPLPGQPPGLGSAQE
ncbi:MAG: portal protein [Elusimicrobiota bacterium]|jgi:hypothetical protein